MSETQTPSVAVSERSISHESMADERLGSMLAGMGNHEGKAALIGLMQPEAYYGLTDLADVLRRRPYAGEAPYIDRSSPMAWGLQSLEPIGMVAKLTVTDRTEVGLSEEGVFWGQALTGIVLPFGDKYDMALTRLWGETQSRGAVRSPYARLKIIDSLLASNGPMTPTAIGQVTGLGVHAVDQQLSPLSLSGLISYEAWDHAKQEVLFRIKRPDHELSSQASPTLKLAFEYVSAHGSADLATLDTLGWESLNADEQASTTRPAFRYKLNRALNDLTKNGVTEREGRKIGQNTVNLTAEQRSFWQELFDDLSLYQTGDTQILEEFRARGQAFLANSAALKRSLIRSRESQAKSANAMGKDIGGLILEALRSSGPSSVRSLTELVNQTSGRRVSSYGMRSVLLGLTKEDVLVEVQGKVKHYELRESATSRDLD